MAPGCLAKAGQFIPRDEPVMTITSLGGKVFHRCRHCADEQPPEDLPLMEARSIQIPVTPKSFARVGASALPFDFKAAQVAREPGSDDE
jgi:hypothetical protein